MKYIEVGHAHFSNVNANLHKAGYTTAKKALKMIKTHPIRLILVFISDKYIPHDENNNLRNDVLNGIQQAIKEITGGDNVPLIGTSVTAGIYNGLAEDSIIVTVLASEHIKAYVSVSDGVFDDPDDPDPGYQKAVKKAFDSLGEDAKKDLEERKPGFFLMFPPGYHESDGRKLYLDYEIHRHLMTLLPPYLYPIFGCSGADSLENSIGKRKTSFQLVNDKIYEGQFAMAYIQTGLQIGYALTHGIKPTEKRIKITKVRDGSKGNIVDEIDGRPALDVFEELEERYGKKQVMFGTSDIHSRPSIVCARPTSDSNYSLAFAGKLQESMDLEVMTTDIGMMCKAGGCALEDAKRNWELKVPVFVLIFSCTARLETFIVNGIDVDKIIKEQVMPVLPDVSVVGGFGYGEQGMDETRSNISSTWSIVTLVLDDRLTPRAKREYDLEILNDTNRRMILSSSLKQAVKELLSGIQRIGYDGAMLSLERREKGMIEAIDAIGSNWRKIKKITKRAIRGDDILAIAVRENRPIVISDSRNQPNCNQDAVAIAKVVAQAVLPLSVSERKAIGAIQVGFATATPITSEDLKTLIAFANQAAVIIMQKQSIEELETSRKIDEIIAESRAMLSIEDSLNTFCEKVVKLIGTDTAHVRLMDRDVLRMVAGYGKYWRRAKHTIRKLGEWPTGRVAMRKRGLVINDIERCKPSLDMIRAYRERGDGEIANILLEMKSFACYPLIGHDGSVIGTFNTESRKKYLFDKTKRQLIYDLSHRIVPAIENALAVKDLSMLFRHTEALIKDTIDVEELPNEEAKRLARITGADTCSIYMYNDDIERFVLKGAYGWEEDMINKSVYARNEHLTGSLALYNKIEILSDTARNFNWPATKYGKEMFGILSDDEAIDKIVIPLFQGDESRGIITLHKRRKITEHELPFREKRENILRVIGDEVQIVLEAIRLFTESKRRINELTTLRKTSDVFIAGDPLESILSQEPILSQIAEITANRLGAEACSIYIADDSGQSVTLRGAYGYPHMLLNTAFFKRNESITGTVFALGIIINIKKDVARHPEWSGKYDKDIEPQLPSKKYKSFISIPLKVKDRIIGVMNLVNRKLSSDHPYDWFSKSDEELLTTLANQLSLGIDNIRLMALVIELGKNMGMAELGLIIAQIVHELNTPLQGILFSLSNLKNEMESGKSLEESIAHIGRIESVTETVAEIINSTLEFSRRDRIERRELVDLQEILEIAMASERMAIGRETFNIENYTKSFQIMANKSDLAQVFVNIIENAIESMPNGGTLTIRSEVDDKNNLVNIRFTDTGVGMSEEIKNRIFEPFFTTKGSKGTGLGLLVCHRIIKDHDGNITVESKPNQGSTFTVSVPIAK
jgi:signal transduction histidine kinase